MTPQATIGALIVGTWATWAGARTVGLWWSSTRQSAARLLAPGRPALRLNFDQATRHEILHGRSGLRRMCRRCWWRRATQVDHLIPASRGGSNSACNGAPLCRACNAAKSDRLVWWAVLRWVTPWVGRRWPVPTPVMLAVAMVAAVVMMKGTI